MKAILPASFKGIIQCDGYSGYRPSANGRAGAITLAGCWAHVRRKFYEARDQSPRLRACFRIPLACRHPGMESRALAGLGASPPEGRTPNRSRVSAVVFSKQALSAWLLRQLQHLYRIESALRDQKPGPKLRQAVRAHQSRPVVERLERALTRLKKSGRFLPQSLVGSAMDYALGQWPTLQVYLGDGRVEIDNNLVENAIRPKAIGKKN